jgi:hypothetical protein
MRRSREDGAPRAPRPARRSISSCGGVALLGYERGEVAGVRPFPRRRCASRTAIGEEIDQQLRWCCAAVAVVRVGPTASTLSGGSAPRPNSNLFGDGPRHAGSAAQGLASRAFASLRSAVSNPSVNQSSTSPACGEGRAARPAPAPAGKGSATSAPNTDALMSPTTKSLSAGPSAPSSRIADRPCHPCNTRARVRQAHAGCSTSSG